MKRSRIFILALLAAMIPAFLNIGKVLPLSVREILKRGEPINILLLGIDARPDEVTARSDTIILASLNHELNKAALVWIPRDTRIASPNKSQKINMVNQIQGPETTCKEVGKLLNTSVDYYILTNFTGFEQIIDVLGGIDMEVDINLSSYDDQVYLKKGYQHLNGKQALKYARYRGRIDGDIGRTYRQQNLAKAVVKQALQARNIEKIPELLSTLRKNVQTNLSLTDMLYLADVYTSLDDSSLITQTLPGCAYTDPYSGASYWEVDRQIARSILESLFHGHKYEIDMYGLPDN